MRDGRMLKQIDGTPTGKSISDIFMIWFVEEHMFVRLAMNFSQDNLKAYSKFLIIRLLGPRKKEEELSRKARYQEKANRSV